MTHVEKAVQKWANETRKEREEAMRTPEMLEMRINELERRIAALEENRS